MKKFYAILTALLMFAAMPTSAISARFWPDLEGVCTRNLTVDGYAAGSVNIRTASEENPGASASFRSYGWSPWPRFTGSVNSVYHYEDETRVRVSVGRNTGTQWISYYVYRTVTRWCDD